MHAYVVFMSLSMLANTHTKLVIIFFSPAGILEIGHSYVLRNNIKVVV